MELKPLGDRIIVKPLEKENETKSGLIIPKTDSDAPEQGEVVSVGSGLFVKVGDTVLFKKYSPDSIKHNEEDYLILSELDVLAIVESE